MDIRGISEEELIGIHCKMISGALSEEDLLEICIKDSENQKTIEFRTWLLAIIHILDEKNIISKEEVAERQEKYHECYENMVKEEWKKRYKV